MNFPWYMHLAIPAIIVCWYAAPALYRARPRRKKEEGFAYIYVENDGSARELNAGERKYLSTEFEGTNGARPYIKSYYEELTPDENVRGYLLRRQLPHHIAVRPVE